MRPTFILAVKVRRK